MEDNKNELEILKSCIKDYTEKLVLEKDANKTLILQNEDNCKMIDELKEALMKKLDVKDVEIQTEDDLLEVKQEQKSIIEID